MATATKSPSPIERTEHPHVVKSSDTLGGEPRIDGTRIPIRMIFNLVEAGTSPREVIESYPDLTLTQVYDAVSYALDHQDEMGFHEQRHNFRNVMKKHDLVMVNSRLVPRYRLKPSDIPEGAAVYTWETLPEEKER